MIRTGVDLLPGQRLAVPTRDGRVLAAVAAGEGSPTVVLEAGAGASAASWYGVWSGLAERTRVVAYDRAGLGRSARDHAPRTLQRMAEDLEDVVRSCGGPVVLVGHSLGGPLSRMAAATLQEQVVGLVSCDPAQEDADLYYRRAYRVSMRAVPATMATLARAGLAERVLRRLLPTELEGTPLPEHVLDALSAEMGSVPTTRTMGRECAHLVQGMSELAAAPVVLPVPLTVISGGRTTKRDARLRAELVAKHTAMAQRWPHGRHVVAERSGHLVPQQQPDLVVDEVLRLLEHAPEQPPARTTR